MRQLLHEISPCEAQTELAPLNLAIYVKGFTYLVDFEPERGYARRVGSSAYNKVALELL